VAAAEEEEAAAAAAAVAAVTLPWIRGCHPLFAAHAVASQRMVPPCCTE